MTVGTIKRARNGFLASRVWSRGITTSYAYDALGQLISINYSDTTPDVFFAYDRLGRVVSAITAVSSHLFEYAGLDLVGEIQDGVAITRFYDAFGRQTGFALDGDHAVSYGYDTFGRLHSVSSSVCSVCSVVNYSCLPGSDLVSGYTAGPLAVTKTYEPRRNLITTVSNHVNHVNPVLISAYDYANDAAGRRVSRNGDTFGYNARSEVISAVIGTNDYGYAYDAIGNRVWSAVNTLTNSYTANRLNQYTAVTPPIAVAYDADGNMTYLGEWYHTWDAENRLTGSQPAGFATNGAVRLKYQYNHRNLRIAKITERLSGRGADYPFNPLQPGTWDAIETRRYVWDGYNITAEIVIDEVAPSTNVTYYTWGLDLSGTLQGAGGVGGLLAVTTADLAQPNSLTTYYPSYDANGNITEYVDAYGNIRAHYEYSPFGETIAQSGDLADTFTHRFSTKPFDAETSLVMYQLRPYAPGLGRWMSRDPIGERGGRNLYGFVENDSANRWDSFGLSSFTLKWVGEGAKYDGNNLWVGLWLWPESPPEVGYVAAEIHIKEVSLKKCDGTQVSGNISNGSLSTLDRFLDSKFFASYTPRNGNGDDGIWKGAKAKGRFSNGIYYVPVNTSVFSDGSQGNKGLVDCQKGKVVIVFSYQVFNGAYDGPEWSNATPSVPLFYKDFESFTNEALHKPVKKGPYWDRDATWTSVTLTIDWDWCRGENRQTKKINKSPSLPIGPNRAGR